MRILMILFLLASAMSGLVVASEQPATSLTSTSTTYLVIYRPGPSWPDGLPVSQLPLREHGRFLLELYKNGSMTLAGPFTNDTGGAVVLKVASEAEAKGIVERDPAVTEGIFVYELHPWAPVQWQQFLKPKETNASQ